MLSKEEHKKRKSTKKKTDFKYERKLEQAWQRISQNDFLFDLDRVAELKMSNLDQQRDQKNEKQFSFNLKAYSVLQMLSKFVEYATKPTDPLQQSAGR